MFDIEPITADATDDAFNYQALGAAAVAHATARLLYLDHKVAVPVTDDDGVDLIVDYRTLVQVKCSGHHNASGALVVGLENSRASERRHGHGLKPHVDVLMVYARTLAVWWIIPAAEVPRSNAVTLGYTYDEWREAWEVFQRAGGG